MDTIQKNDRIIHSVFISDFHLGTKACKADFLSNFLKHIGMPENIFLVGDIIDFWRLSFWCQKQSDIVQKLFKLSKKGCKIYYITGNHDEYLREFKDFKIGNIDVVDIVDYHSLSDKKIKIIHGDQYDNFLNNLNWLGHIGSWAYDILVEVNTFFNNIRRRLGLKYWSLSQFVKEKIKFATKVVHNFETILVDTCIKEGYNAVICGHMHIPNIIKNKEFVYMNCGDWTENCTAIIEYNDGVFELVTYKNNKLVKVSEWNPKE